MTICGNPGISQTSCSEHGAVCVGHSDLFLHPLFDVPSTALGREQRRTLIAVIARADRLCQTCPLATQCLYQAVVRHDVAGFVAGTTPSQRQAMRTQLRWTIVPEPIDRFIGITAQHQVDHDEIVRMRRNCPSETLETIAARLDCSLSTVKRHLRQARAEERPTPPRPHLTLVAPSVRQVLDAREVVLARTASAGDARQAA